VPQIFIRCDTASSVKYALAKPPKRMSFDTRSGLVAAKNALSESPRKIPGARRVAIRCRP
jgi:hypothetical protein